ncbi:MAG: nucleotidyltransferase domain-containing protein [Proteobacteria bacterium]|nr:nucleotidyltransferase domain-containing protein [Pseudomonadota bacterium]
MIGGLATTEMTQLTAVLARHGVTRAALFGSRAKGTQRPNSDIDLAVWGLRDDDAYLRLCGELETLNSPYRFDVVRYETITHQALREHIDLVQLPIYPKI